MIGAARYPHWWPLLALIVASAAMTGCDTLMPLSSTTTEAPLEARSWQQHRAHLERMDHWRMRGKIGYQSGHDAGSAWIDWVQTGGDYHIQLSGPLGQGATILSGNEHHARLEGQDGVREADSPEALLEAQSGLQLPVSQMLYWVRGLPAPDLPQAATLTADNTLDHLEQGVWRLNYDGYTNALDNRLPGKLKIQGQGLRLTLVVKAWEAAP